MTRPDVACLCVDLGVYAALTVYGEHRDRMIEQFIAQHTGPGHVPVSPTKDWHGRPAEFRRYLERVRRELAALDPTGDVVVAHTARDVEIVDPKGKL